MTIIDRIIKFLGGFTNIEYVTLDLEYKNQRELALNNRARVESLEKELAYTREERKILQDLIFIKFGITSNKEEGLSQEELEPIRTSPQRWSSLRGKLEEDDRQRATGMASGKTQ